MGLPSIFKKKNETVPIVEMQPEETELKSIAVRDIKAYLVEEFKRANDLNAELEEMKEKELNEYRPLQAKLDAALVLLDEYKERLEKAERKCSDLERKLFVAKDEVDAEREKKHNFQIRLEKIGKDVEAIRKNTIYALAPILSRELSEQIVSVKGNLSKSKAREIVTSICTTSTLFEMMKGEENN